MSLSRYNLISLGKLWHRKSVVYSPPEVPLQVGPIPPSRTTTITYTYDPLYRLTAADYDDGRYFNYAYDATGNRLTQDTGIVTNSYVYDSANRLTSVDGQAYTYDNNGNLLSDGVSTNTYDKANRLIAVSGQPSAYSFAYNGLGDRLQQTVDTVTANYTLDLNTGLTQVLSDGTNTYLYGLGRIGEYESTNWNYYLTDALGSVRQLTDSTGSIAMAQSYAPYGDVTETAGETSSNYGYAGEWTDGTGLQHLRARYLNTGIGRFVSRDTWAGDYNRPLSLNRWMYVEGNPIMRVDPSGLSYALGMAGLSLSQLSGSNYSNNNYQAMKVLTIGEGCDDLNLDAIGVDLKNPTQESLPQFKETSIAIFDYEENQTYTDDQKWRLDETKAIEAEVRRVAAKYAEVINEVRYWWARYLGIPYSPISPLQAFKEVHGGKVTFTRMNETCNPQGGGCWGQTISENEIRIYSNASAEDIKDHSRLITHELGHAFNYATDRVAQGLPPAYDEINVNAIENFLRPQTGGRIDHIDDRGGNYGYAGGRDQWQFGYSGTPGSEEFADMFIGWVYSRWEATDLGDSRRTYMNRKMQEHLFNSEYFTFP